MNPELARQVWARANCRCEYCHVPDVYEPGMHVDHIVAVQHGGGTVPENLALACVHCNRHKGPNVAGIDQSTGELVRLFHPRVDNWREHFRWDGAELIGRTPIGKVTIQLLRINETDFRSMRASLMNDWDYGWE